jgi:ABC-type transport system involved in multi-copper enzyme maturation permease subunit
LLSAKFAALLVYTIFFSFVLGILIAGLSIASSLVAGVDVALSVGAVVDAVWYVVATIVANLPILAFAFMLATLARSNAAGIAGALGLTFIEPTAFGLLGMISDVFQKVQKWGIGWNVQEIVGNWSGSTQNWVSVGVIALYTALFAGLSYVVFLRRDVTSG